MIDLAAVIGQFLDPPEPGVLVELDRDDARALAAEVRAARAVVDAARLVGLPHLGETDVAKHLAAKVAAYDQATGTAPSSRGVSGRDDPARLGPGDLLAALGELAPGRAAEVYAALGYPVVPMHATHPGGTCTCRRGARCADPGKHPCLAGWPRAASTTPAEVRRWWRRWPLAGVGLVTGSRFDVLDLDGPEGVEALRAALSHRHPWEHTGPVARTGGGGWHLLYAPTGLGNRVGLLAGVDWRGRGGLVVAPPSVHPSGQPYRWVRPLAVELPRAPEGLRRLLAPPRPATPPPAEVPAGRAGAWARGALAAECATVARTRPGGKGRRGRNHALNRAAFRLGQLVAAGLLDRQAVTAALLDAAAACGLGEPEAAATITSGLAGGERNPRPGMPARSGVRG